MKCFSRHDRHDRHGRCQAPESLGGRIVHYGAHGILAIAVVGAVSLLIGWLVMLTWNCFMPDIFHLPAITFWQAVSLLVLGRLLTGRLHHHRGHKRCCGSKHHADRHDAPVAPPEGNTYARWWWEEGESAFQAYQARTQTQTAAPDATDKP